MQRAAPIVFFALLFALFCLSSGDVIAADRPLAKSSAAQITRIEVAPGEIHLRGPRVRQQLLVSAQFSAPEADAQADVTNSATFASTAPTVCLVTAGGLVVPNGFGEAEIVVRYDRHESRVKVRVSNVADGDPINFNTEVIAAISKAGCSSGACHGSPQGKNGFRLSLRGFDPAFDFDSLTRLDLGRRVNRLSVDDSLILNKGLARIAHQGGVRFSPTDVAYQTLRTWIAQGCQAADPARTLTRLEVLPARRRLHADYPHQRIVARAHFSDGTVRDVTPLAVFESSEPGFAAVSEQGLVTFQQTSEATILVRYLDAVGASLLTYVDRDPQFTFHSPPVARPLDRHVFAKQQALQLQPAKLSGDSDFLRRVHLDLTGTIPTAEAAQAFLDSNDPNKRAALIDALLDSDAYASFWALKWADVMRGSDVTISNRGVHSFHRYLVKNFREDHPFDLFARELLSGLGNTLQHPEANFQRTARTPEDAGEAAAELFLGVRIQCAKCHNHPFEAITQDDYYGLAAFFARVKFKGAQFGRDDEIVYLDRRSEVRHPITNQNVVPSLFGEPVEEISPDQDRRTLLADWLVRPDNPYFARATVNRLWYHLFGQGIVEPVDDFRATNPPSNDELLNELAAVLVKSGFRIKPVLREILNSSTYQLSARPPQAQSPHAAPAERYFTHATLRMLSAEQTLDAISTATGIPATLPGYPQGTRAAELAEGAVDHPFLNAFAKPVRDVICECAREDEPSLNRVIHLMNNPEIVSAVASNESRAQRLVSAGKSDDAVLEQLYLGTLSRRPTEQELTILRPLLAEAKDRAATARDIQHALLISNEFLLRH